MLRTYLLLAASALGLPLSGHAQEAKRYPRDLITREEIDERALDAKDAWEIVQRLRPHFMRERSPGAIAPPLSGANGARNAEAMKIRVQVYVNGARRGTTVALREINREAIIDILYLDSSDATTRFGTGHENGAILVRTGVQ